MGFVANFIRFLAVQKFWKSVKIWQSYGEFKGGNYFLRHSVYYIVPKSWLDWLSLWVSVSDGSRTGHGIEFHSVGAETAKFLWPYLVVFECMLVERVFISVYKLNFQLRFTFSWSLSSGVFSFCYLLWEIYIVEWKRPRERVKQEDMCDHYDQ